jgi:alpha-mannosidase
MDAEFELVVPDRSDRTGRSAGTTPLVITVSMVLDAGARFVRFRVRGVNEARDHRVRVILATGVDAGEVWADAAFGPVRRAIVASAPDEASGERRLSLSPLHRYVTRAGAEGGATVFANGPAEYEPLPDGRIAVTLFRAVGELSRSDLPERPGHAGWPAATPEAQCLGPFEAELALFLHGARTDAVIDQIERTADDVLVPLVGETIRSMLAPPRETEGFALEGAGLAFGACKRADDGDWVVLRCVNLLEHPVHGAWRVGDAIREAFASRLDETPGPPMRIRNGVVEFDARPRGVVTILVR